MKNFSSVFKALIGACALSFLGVQAQAQTTDITHFGGKVGIGIENPQVALEVSGAVNASNPNVEFMVSRYDNLFNPRVKIGVDASSAYIMHTYSSAGLPFNFMYGGNKTLTLRETRVGIGTENPQATLHVNGNLKVNEFNSGGLVFGRYGEPYSGSTNPYMIYFRNDNETEAEKTQDLMLYGDSERTMHLRVLDGSIKMGEPTTPNAQLFNDGSAYFNGDVRAKSKLYIGAAGAMIYQDGSGNLRFSSNDSDGVMTMLPGGGIDLGPAANYQQVRFMARKTNLTEAQYSYNGIMDIMPVTTGAGYVATLTNFRTNTDPNGRFTRHDVKIDGSLIIGSNVKLPTHNELSADAQSYIPTPDYGLVVEKGILTERVKVALKSSADWADYVFKPEYELMTLAEVAKFIKANGHLPGVPSANQVQQDGIDMAQMDAKLLEKTEEAFLYILQQEERIAALEAQMKKQQAEMEELKRLVRGRK